MGSSILVLVVAALDVLKLIFIGDPEYWQAMYIVPIILLANFCLGIYQNLSVWYKVTDMTKFAAYISGVGALITLLLNIILIPNYSFLGSAVATLIAYFTTVSYTHLTLPTIYSV